MLGVGWTEMLVIGVVALIVIGPKELPGLMQKLGRLTATVRRMGSDFQRELNKTTGLDEVRNLRNAISQPLKQTTDAIRKEFNTIGASGEVKPSGAIKPADPKAESVVDEIKAAAGMTATAPAPTMTPAESIRAAVTKATAAPAAGAAPVAAATPPKPRRVVKASPAPTAPVATADLAPAKPAPKPAAAKPVESPAPVEALPPAKKMAAKPKAAAAAKAKVDAAAKPKAAATARRPAAKKS